MKIAITGGTGFVGRKLSLELLRHGHQVVILSRGKSAASSAPLLPIELRTIPESSSAFALQLSDIDQVIHLAGESVAGGRWTKEKKEKIYDSRILGTQHLLKAIGEAQANGASKVKKVIMASAIGFYGSRGEEKLTEASASGDGFLAEVTVDWERALFETSLKEEIDLIAFRLGIVLERDGGALQKLLPLFQAGVGSPIGDGKHWMSWVHLKDVVRAFVWAVESKSAEKKDLGSAQSRHQIFNLVAPNPVRNQEFSEVLSDVINKPMFLPPTPKLALKLALGEMSEVVLGSQNVQAQRLSEAGFEFHFTDLRRALESICACDIEGHDEFSCVQWVPRPVSEVFDFFSSETNLEKITPPWVNFQVLRKSTPEIQEGTLIDYKLRIHGVPQSWTTRIDEWVPNQRFVDMQINGPYDHWRHSHKFEELNGGTLMTDQVRFRVPLGLVGRTVAGSFVRSDVERIFAYRTQVIGELFGKK